MTDWRSYDGIAETYERVRAPHTAQIARDLVALAEPPAGGRVLDVGTGTGVGARAAQEVVGGSGLAIGVDRAPAMVATGRAARPDLRLAAAEAVDLPFRDTTFDAVTANLVVAMFTRYETALFDMLRVLRPGGRLAVSWWADDPDELSETWRELVLSVIQEEMLDDVQGQAIPHHARFADPVAMDEALRRSGLHPVRVERREYRFQSPLEDYVEGRATHPVGRFVREMLGDGGWSEFLERAKRTFAERFADPVNDFRRVLVAVGTKPA